MGSFVRAGSNGSRLMTRIPALAVVLLTLTSGTLRAQNNCSAAPPTGTCPAATAPALTWCAGNNSASTCPGGTSWVGFHTSLPAAGSWTNEFEGLDAASIFSANGNVRPQPDPNGGIGPTNESGVGQYIEFSANYVQAFDRATGNGIFSKRPNTSAAPQLVADMFATGGSSYCANASVDGIATYDRIDGVFVLGNIYNPGGGSSYYYCIGMSAPSGSVPANNLEGTNFASYWNVYAYSLTAAIPQNAKGVTYFPDYARFGSWADGFYVTWDLEDISENYDIVGFEVCKLDKADMIAGLSASAPVCYTYIPAYAGGAGGTDSSLIHTLMPADFEGNNSIPSNTAGEYFLAQVNPSNPGTNNQCTIAPCTSNQLAFWTWSEFVSQSGPTFITLSKAYTPGCYSTSRPYNTICIPEPYGGVIDSLGDRLNYRLAYRYLNNSEYLAVAHTVQELATSQRTGIRYYKILAGGNPSVVYETDLQDATYHMFLSMPSVAMDENGNLGITFTVTGNTKKGSAKSYDPAPYFITANGNGAPGTPVPILSDSGASGQDETDNYWGEYVSVSSDPDDDLTFWAVDEYINGNQVNDCNAHTGSGCKWATRVFACKKGPGC
jgi:hypothetical protein